MSRQNSLGEFEHLVLLAVMRLEPTAYGVNIRQEIEERTGRKVTLGAIYPTLDRLEGKGYVSSSFSKPTAERGGRAKRFFQLEPAGIEAINHTRKMLLSLWSGFETVFSIEGGVSQ
ncbi:PadR family transcriptional regulator [Gemmatimonadota bacterium]